MKLCKHARWCEAATHALAATLGEDHAGIVSDVNAGRNELWEVNDGDAWLVTCVADGDLVICCVAGRGLKEIAAHFIEFARRQGLHRVRWFTRRPALARLLRPHSVELAGYVYHMPLERAH